MFYHKADRIRATDATLAFRAPVDTPMIYDLLLIAGAYLLGSVSSAIIVCRIIGLPDPREQGSKNPGATNVLRIGGKKAAAITLIGDGLKGFLPVLAINLLQRDDWVLAAVALAAFLGHLYPVFFGFRGGKGVATALGTQFGLGWLIGASVAGIWLAMALLLRISSVSALVSMACAPLVIAYFRPSPELIGMSAIMTLWLFWRHRSNIRNLLRGTEDSIGKNS